MTRTLCSVPALVVISVLAAGCGGSSGGSNSNSSQETTTRAQLVAQADPICKQVGAVRSAANAALPKTKTITPQALQALARLAPSVAVYEHQAINRLRALKAPAALSHDWQEMLAGMQQLANDATQLGVYAKSKDAKDTRLLILSGRRVRQRLTVIAAHDGFAYCGRTS